MEGNIVNYITQIRGVSYKPSDLHDSLNKNSIILLRANNINNGKINFEDVVYVDKSKVSETKVLRKNDILICASSGSKKLVGKAASFNESIECTFGAFCKVIRPRNILGSYLSAFFQSEYYKFHISQLANGANINNIKNEHINSFSIPERSFEEQKEISYKVSSLNRIIESYNRELELLDELIKARFVEMFGDPEDNPFKWDKMPLSNIMLNANNGMARRGSDENGNIVLRLVELQDGYINYSNPNRICLNENEKKRYLLKNNDFLFARVNGNPDNVGRCAVFHDIGEDVYHNDHIIRVHFNEELLNGVFASELINSNFGKRQLKKRIKTSAGQYTVSQDGIGAIVSIVPPLELQNQFASFVEEIDKSRLRELLAIKQIKLLLHDSWFLFY